MKDFDASKNNLRFKQKLAAMRSLLHLAVEDKFNPELTEAVFLTIDNIVHDLPNVYNVLLSRYELLITEGKKNVITDR